MFLTCDIKKTMELQKSVKEEKCGDLIKRNQFAKNL